MKRIFSFLSATRLFISILALCSLVAMIGIIIPQNGNYDDYTRQFGDGFSHFILTCGWDHIFSSPWFIIPFSLFCLNLICCLGNHLLLLSSSTFFGIEKKRLGAAGSFLLHAGVLFLVAGGVIQYFFGAKQSVILSEATQEIIEKFHIKIFLHDFSIIRNNQGEIVNYRSNLEVCDTGNTTLICGATMVNAPMRYHGLYLYQTNYGYVPDAVKNFRAVVTDSTGDTLFSTTVPYKVNSSPGKDNLILLCTDFLSDFYYDFGCRMPMTPSHEHTNPAFKIALSRHGSMIASQWIFPKFPALSGRFGRYTVTIPSYDPLFYSGILVQKKPGIACIWIGIISVSIGMAILFLSPFRKAP